MRPIDADAVIADVKKNNQTNFDKQDWTSRNVCTLLIGAPTIDAALYCGVSRKTLLKWAKEEEQDNE